MIDDPTYKPGADPEDVLLEAGIGGVVPESALRAELEREDMEGRERLYNPSDLQDVGDPEGTDVGLPFGLASGGEMAEGARDYDSRSNDPWGVALNHPNTDTLQADLGIAPE